MTSAKVRELLQETADEKFKEFNDKLMNCPCVPSFGVRMPDVRKIAQQIIKDGWEEYLEEMENRTVQDCEMTDCKGNREASVQIYQEEHILQGIVLGTAEMSREHRVKHLNSWITGVMSWADCDSSVSSFKFMRQDQDFWFQYLCGWLDSRKEFEVRVALVALMQYFIRDEYIDQVLEIFSRDYRASFSLVTPESYDSVVGTPDKSTQASFSAGVPYYIKMAQAWALSVCFVKFRDKTWEVFAKQSMEPWVQNKAIQKCRESYRVSAEDKEMLLKWKMKTER